MDKSSSLAPFAFILHRSAPGSVHSCFWPARKLLLKLALWSEWLISHIVGMKVNERSKETASLYLPDMLLTNLLEYLVCLQPVASREGQQVMLLVVQSERIWNGNGCPFSLATSTCKNKSHILCLFFLLCNAPCCFQSLCCCCKSACFLVCAACSLRMNEVAWISLIWAKPQLKKIVHWVSLWIEIDHSSIQCLLGFQSVNEQSLFTEF